ncbi:MAG: hypothetical protein KDA91_02915 [Planctomycetaceae bacterium]|nr:hypothetical protein [Planctomycetaceae bacterium]
MIDQQSADSGIASGKSAIAGAEVESNAAASHPSGSNVPTRVQLALLWPLEHRRPAIAVVILAMMGLVYSETPPPDSVTEAPVVQQSDSQEDMVSAFPVAIQDEPTNPFSDAAFQSPPETMPPLQIPVSDQAITGQEPQQFDSADVYQTHRQTLPVHLTGAGERTFYGTVDHSAPQGHDSPGIRFRGAINPVP